jgi:V-type H+-transporting ATPase subunit a
MLLGIIIFGVNSNYFSKWVDLLIVFPAKLIFFVTTIGYMVFLITLKWLTVWPDTSKAPSIINTLVSMWLHFGSYGELPMWGDGSSQQNLQIALIIITVLCVPLMVVPSIMSDYSHMKDDPEKRKK